MARRFFRIAGRRPTIRWKRNVGRKRRTITEAIEIATRHGVIIPCDVEFAIAGPDELGGTLSDLLAGGDMDTAIGPGVSGRPDGYVYWADHYDQQTNTIR